MTSSAKHFKHAALDGSTGSKQPKGRLVQAWRYVTKTFSLPRSTIDKKTANALKQLLVPFDVGHTKTRLGSDHDGGYVLSGDVLPYIKRVYSLGISNDCYIDLVLASQDKRVYQYDKNPCKTPTHPNMQFKQLFMDSPALRDELKKTGALTDKSNMLLMDIEGGEYDIVLGSADLLSSFAQISLELHAVLVSKNVENLLCRLNETHTLIHIHANNWVLWPGYKSYTGYEGIQHGLPDLLELTYVRNDTFSTKKISKERSPTPIDKRNIPKFRDVEMSWWCR